MKAHKFLRLLLTLAPLASSAYLASVALAVEPDRTGPRLVSAVVKDDGATNRIFVTFDERLLFSSATRPANYTITLFGTTNQVPIQAALYQSGPGSSSTVFLRVGTNNWYVGGSSNYYLTVNHVQDLATNTIAPDSRIGISWPRYTEVLSPDAVWHYHSAPFLEPDIFQQPWASCDYRENSSWAEGPGPFWTDPFWPGWPPPSDCLAPFGTQIVSKGGPVLFRTRFVCPQEYAADGLLRFDYLLNEAGAVFYLNGVEFSRVNLCPAPTPITNQCCVNYFVAPPPCGTTGTAVTNLVAGTNCLAVAVFPGYCLGAASCFQCELTFGLRLWATRLITGPVPAEDSPRLQIAPLSTNTVRLWWVGSGYALETTTNLPPGAATSPGDPWTEVSDVSNPYTNSTTSQSSRFFRLRK